MSDKSVEGMEHIEATTKVHDGQEKKYHDDAAGANLELDEDALPPGYYRSKFFVGTMAGIGLGLMAGVAAYGYAAPILGLINADIGPVSAVLTNIARNADSRRRTQTLYGLPSHTPLPRR
jgi:hypothetical protein